VAGGMQLFGELSHASALRLVDARSLGTGLVSLTFVPARTLAVAA